MSVWATIPVLEQPALTLVRWAVFEVLQPEPRTRHLVGWCLENVEGRVSSNIVSFDEKLMRGTTKSGRVYQLKDETNGLVDPIGIYVLKRWHRVNRTQSWMGVTVEELVQALKETQ